MRSISRLPAAVFCCTLSACASTGITWQEGLWTFGVKDEPATAPPAVHPDFVEVFWIGETPEYPFDVIGRFSLRTFSFPDNVVVQRRVRKLAGKRGANVVVFQHDESVEEYCDSEDCYGGYRLLRGVLGRRPD
jgi:hypothetical protein